MTAVRTAYAGRCEVCSLISNHIQLSVSSCFFHVMCPGCRRWLWWVSSTTGTPKQSTGPQEITLACGSCSCQTQQRALQPSPTGAPPLPLLQNPPGGVWGGFVVQNCCSGKSDHLWSTSFTWGCIALCYIPTVTAPAKTPCAASLRLLIDRIAVLALLLKFS